MDKANRKIFIEERHINKIQLLCLLIMAVMELLVVTLGNVFLLNAGRLLQLGLLGSCGLFLLCELLKMYQSRRIRFPVLPLIMVVWYLINSFVRSSMQMDTYYTTLFIPVYLLIAPFVSLTHDEENQTGLKISSVIFIAAGLILCFDALLLVIDYIPGVFAKDIYWDGTRLFVFLHSNLSARVFMIGIAFCVGFFTRTRKIWLRILLAAATLAMFFATALTNCRSSNVVTYLMVAGTVFFTVYKNGWKQFISGAAAAVVVMGLLVFGGDAIYDWNCRRLDEISQSHITEMAVYEENEISASSSSAEGPEANTVSQIHDGVSPQGSFFEDLLSLNSRTMIWGNMLKGLLNEPTTFLWGCRSVEELVGISGITHTHNGLFQSLVKLGLPGFILSLIFAIQALWSAVYVLLSRKTDLWKKVVAMLTGCLLISAMMEPFLFISSEHYHFADFFFFLCLGYLTAWRKALRKG